jgi:hypothetical protein
MVEGSVLIGRGSRIGICEGLILQLVSWRKLFMSSGDGVPYSARDGRSGLLMASGRWSVLKIMKDLSVWSAHQIEQAGLTEKSTMGSKEVIWNRDR